jgi:hypothetical protein
LKALQTDLDWLTRDYGKMEIISAQSKKILVQLDNNYLQQSEQLMEVNIDMENYTHELGI